MDTIRLLIYNNTTFNMKNHSFISKILIFCIVFFIFMLPPVLQGTIENNAFTDWNFSYSALITALFMGFIYFIYRDFIVLQEEKKSKFYKIKCTFCSLLYLLMISVIIRFLPLNGKEIAVKLPANPSAVTFCLLNFLFSAFTEEVLYRFYAPEILCNMLEEKIGKKNALIISEIFVGMMFALGHRYAGIPAVINSILGYAVLRMNIKKTGSLAMNTALHFIYNIAQLLI